MANGDIYAFDGFVLYASALKLETASGEEVRLEPQVLQLLLLLVENHDRVVSKEEINQKVWGGRIITDAALTSRLWAARSAVGDSGSQQRLIKTIPNVGLRFVGDVRKIDPSEPKPFLQRALHYVWSHKVKSVLGAGLMIIAGFAIWYFLGVVPREQLHAHFQKTPDAAIRYYNHKKIRDASVEKCMKACLETTEFTCRSFDYYKRLATCDLSAATAESAGGLKTDYELDPYDHYARKEYPPGPIELGRDDTLTPIYPKKLSDAGVED